MKYYIAALLCLVMAVTHAQKYKSIQSNISYFSEAPVENIAAYNTGAAGTLLYLTSQGYYG